MSMPPGPATGPPSVEAAGSTPDVAPAVAAGAPLNLPADCRSIPHLIFASVRAHGPKRALAGAGPGSTFTYDEFGRAVEEVALGLDALGIGPGDRVCILSGNRPEWPICDFAVMALGGVSVPLHHVQPPNQIEYILRDARTKAVVVENAAQMAKLDVVTARCPDLEHVVGLEPFTSTARRPIPFEELRARGRARRLEDPSGLTRRLETLEPDGVCSIVYTSGTTGEPKGVMLHHRGFLSVVIGCESVLGLRPDDVFLSFLPLSHLYERVAGHWCPLYRGCTIAYVRDTSSVLDDMARVKPTMMVSVPRIYEKMRSRIESAAAAGGGMSRRVFAWALDAGRRYQEACATGRAGALRAMANGLADRFVFRRVRARLGGRLRFPVSGGAPLPVDTLAFFKAIGLHLIEGYGMTETHLIVTLTPAGETRIGSCGRPIPGVTVSVAGDGEVLVRGNTVMRGYQGKDAATLEAIDQAGWLHTGDIGRLDADGFLYITDRKKNLIVTAGGKNVAPAPIESDLRASPFIEEVCLVGDRRKFVAALVVPDFTTLESWARQQGLETAERARLVAQPAVIERIMEEIRARQTSYAPYEQVRKCTVLAEPFSLERGELTPSLKVRRRVVEEHFRQQIEQMYGGA